MYTSVFEYSLTLLETIRVVVPSTWNVETALCNMIGYLFTLVLFYYNDFSTVPNVLTVRTAVTLRTFFTVCELERRQCRIKHVTRRILTRIKLFATRARFMSFSTNQRPLRSLLTNCRSETLECKINALHTKVES